MFIRNESYKHEEIQITVSTNFFKFVIKDARVMNWSKRIAKAPCSSCFVILYKYYGYFEWKRSVWFFFFCQKISFQIRTTFTVDYFLGFPSTYRTQRIKRTGFCVFETTFTQEPQYLILLTSPALTTGDTSSTTTTELILRILRGMMIMPSISSVKWKYTVGNLICPDRTQIKLVMICVKVSTTEI